jgi:hypothetical protein
MKQVRKLLLVMFTSILVMASSSATANQNNSNDLDLIFGVSATQSMELSLLSDQEMRETEGELGWIAGGALIGASINLYLYLGNSGSNWSFTGVAIAVSTGAFGGAAAASGIPGATAYGASLAAFGSQASQQY